MSREPLPPATTSPRSVADTVWTCGDGSMTGSTGMPPILADKHHGAPSAFTPESLLREARRQKGAAVEPVPAVCILDPEGDIVRMLRAAGRARRHAGWVCYHTELDVFELEGMRFGVVGCAVGAAFAVLVAEELFASGCQWLISITSAGQITATGTPPYFVLIERAWRDEGTSYHYLPPGDWSAAPAGLLGRDVICFAHVTNQMGRIDGDFEKGPADGAAAALEVILRTARNLKQVTVGLGEDHPPRSSFTLKKVIK